MTAPYQATTITPRITDAHKRAVWRALTPPARLLLRELAEVSGVDQAICTEIWAQGHAAGKLRYVDQGVGYRGIERVTP